MTRNLRMRRPLGTLTTAFLVFCHEAPGLVLRAGAQARLITGLNHRTGHAP
jgi:hypothetical protein